MSARFASIPARRAIVDRRMLSEKLAGADRKTAARLLKDGIADIVRGNVRVNAIAPGYTMTDILKTVPQELLDGFAKQTMLGRLGQPYEIANATLFLASDESSYVTGQVLSVDGGMRL